MLARNMSVTFHTDVNKTKPWFHIPKSVAQLLSVKSGDVLAVGISKPDGELIYHGLAKMDSGTEMPPHWQDPEKGSRDPSYR